MGETSAYANHGFVPDSRNNSWSNMLSFIPEGSRVLDVGCSVGNFAEALEKMNGCSVVGVDLNADDIAEARGKISEAYVLDVTDGKAVATLGTFDVVIFADVLEHLVDPRGTLRAIRELLRPNGVIVYSIPNMGHLSVRLDLMGGRFSYTETGLLDKTHLHYYDAHEIEDMFTAAGYGILTEDPVVSEYPKPWVTEKLAGLGLTANEEFFNLIKSSESHVFQYVGVAIPLAGLPRNTAPKRPGITPIDEILNYANRILAENDRLKNTDALALELGQTRVERDALTGEVAGLRQHLAFMKKHPFKFLARKVSQRFSRVRR